MSQAFVDPRGQGIGIARRLAIAYRLTIVEVVNGRRALSSNGCRVIHSARRDGMMGKSLDLLALLIGAMVTDGKCKNE